MDIKVNTIKDVKLNIAKLSKVLRKSQKLSRNDLAEQLNKSRITIQNLETGKNVTVDTLMKILQHFDLLEKFNAFFEEEIKNKSYDSLY